MKPAAGSVTAQSDHGYGEGPLSPYIEADARPPAPELLGGYGEGPLSPYIEAAEPLAGGLRREVYGEGPLSPYIEAATRGGAGRPARG